jgi:uncharacterized protein YndB with AHSA1/START domain
MNLTVPTPLDIDREHLALHFRRRFKASREDVFAAWTTPEQLTQWWDPTGAPLASCSVDLRVGGNFAFVNAGHGPPFAGTYRVLERPSKLVFEAMGAVGTVELTQDGEETLMRVSIESPTREHFEQFMRFGVHEGTSKTLDNLVALFGR